MIKVVTAAIVDVQANRLFVQRRSGKTKYPWHWCMPGGQMQHGETPWEALYRELGEEHGVRILDRDELPHDARKGCILYEYRDGELSVDCYLVLRQHVIGVFQALDQAVAGFDWVTANELETLSLTPADHANRGVLMGLIR